MTRARGDGTDPAQPALDGATRSAGVVIAMASLRTVWRCTVNNAPADGAPDAAQVSCGERPTGLNGFAAL